jgi:hypothetical protein
VRGGRRVVRLWIIAVLVQLPADDVYVIACKQHACEVQQHA